MNNLLNEIANKIDRGDAPDSKFPSCKGEYWALCPYHADTHAKNFSFSERGYHCFSCGAKGSLAELAQKLGVGPASQNQTNTPTPLTLESYAQSKSLDVAFLEGLGLSTVHIRSKPAVKIPYYDQDGDEVAARFRLSMTGKEERFRWRTGSRVYLYGLWKLKEAKQAGYVFVVEGESDSQTLWSYGLPAVGVPGAQSWQSDWADYIKDLKVYIWQEPDEAGAGFVKSVGDSLPEAWVITPPQGRKDISECHILGDDVPDLAQTLRNQAIPYNLIRSEATAKAVAAAEKEATDLLACTDILTRFGDLCETLGLVGETENAKLLYLALTSRLLEKPVSIAVKGPSAGGKSYTIQTVLSAFPDSAYYVLSSMSERALAYSEEPLQHRALVILEASGFAASDFGSYLVRSLLSEGYIKYETVEKTQDGLKPKLIEREGPTNLVTSTTWAKLNQENETRLLSLTVKDTQEQTKAVMEALADQACDNGRVQPDLTSWHSLQTWLELAGVCQVVIPYAKQLAEGANPLAVRLRRDFGIVLNLIKSHAVLHQRHRRREGDHVVATLEDYSVVYDLAHDLLSEGVQATVKPETRDTVEAVRDLCQANGGDPVTVVAVAHHLGLDKSSASRRVRVAIAEGYLVNQETKKGQPYKLVIGERLPQDQPILPHPDDLGGGGGCFTPPTTAQPRNRATTQFVTDALGEAWFVIEGALAEKDSILPTDNGAGIPFGKAQLDKTALQEGLDAGLSQKEARDKARIRKVNLDDLAAGDDEIAENEIIVEGERVPF